MNDQETGVSQAADHLDDETIAARAHALSVPIRWRVLRAAMSQALTNKELAYQLGVNPGSMLHHVRTLVSTGFLEAEEPRRGARNAVEIPYRTTDLLWAAGRSSAGFTEFLLHNVEVAETQGEAKVWRGQIRTDDVGHAEFQQRLVALFEEFHDKGGALPEGTGRTWSVMASLRPED